jgi:class 3 adenylate cyclase
MPAMTEQPMPHATGVLPFYRERTFLLLLGAAGAGAGFLGYRVLRRRRHRRSAPAGFVNEAVLAVDLVGSTHVATHYGEGLAMRARNTLRERLAAAAQGHGLAFVESTGDGSLMTFTSVTGAVATAVRLLRDLGATPPDLAPGPPLEVRIGISYGEVLLDAGGGRHAAAINKAFRLEGLGRESFAPAAGAEPPQTIADRNRIFLDEEAAKELEPGHAPIRFVGFAALKGFSGLHRVYEITRRRPETESATLPADERAGEESA